MSECKHPFNHTGAGRIDRLLKALMPSNVAIDNREMADLMVFAARFGKVIKYWDEHNTPDGDWSYFWESDYLFFLATVAASDREGVERTFRQLEKHLLDNQETTPSPESKRLDTLALVHIIRQLAIDVASWGQEADVFPALQQDIAAIVRNSLRQPLRDLIACAKGLSCDEDFAAFIIEFNAHPFAKEWNITQLDYEQNIDFIDPTIDYLASWQALRKIFRRFIIAHERISKQASKYLETTQNDPNQRQHPPHIVLFISFLHLFKHLQNQLNALPEKHLNYYYNDILHLQNRGEIPDHAHLVFQLARNVFQQTLSVGTLFRAGKTPDGKDMFYALERPLTLNQAQVVEVKTLLVQNRGGGYLWENTLLDADKKTETTDKMKEVLPFRPLGKAGEGKKSAVGFAISSAILPKSKSYRTIRLNFKPNTPISNDLIKKLNTNFDVNISTKEVEKPLIIKELEQKLTVFGRCVDRNGGALVGMSVLIENSTKGTLTDVEGNFSFTDCPSNATLLFSFPGFLSHEENVNGRTRLGNITLADDGPNSMAINEAVVVATASARDFNYSNFNISLSEGLLKMEAVIPKKELPFDAPTASKDNNTLFNEQSPVLKVAITEKSADYEEIYNLFSTTSFENINAVVGVSDLTDFDMYEGSVNSPLGHTQNVNLSNAMNQGGLIVRCDEAFRKGLDRLTITFTIKEATDTLIFTKIKDATLFINGKERGQKIAPVGNSITISNIKASLIGGEQEQEQLDGFIKIDLFKNATYARPTGLNVDLPTFADARMAYSISRDLNKSEFFHLSSHGGYEAVEPTNSAFFPPFVNPEPAYTEGGKDSGSKFMAMLTNRTAPVFYRGNLYIGVKDIPKLGILSLLFQVANGTEIDLDAFPPDIEWSYLSTNETEKWQRFPSSSIVFDSTKADENSKRSLVQSGIIEFQMPKDIKLKDTVLNPNYYWIRASALETATPVNTTVGALPSLVGIYAQAGSVQLATSPIVAQHFAQPLPPTTIAQLKFREAAVRLIEQPYESFGGRAAEQGAAYHLRISERLRHKKRAITAWDYEHLVLEQFPEIRFVKCINHSFPISKTDFNTRKTGAVALVVMPLKTLSPLQPQTNRSALENIQSYLKKYCNGFTSGDDLLKVIPPQYQEVVVSLKVKFHAGDIEKHVHNLDNDIARFIAPWAFDNQIDPNFGKNLYKTELLSQIESLDYVNFIEDLYIENRSSVTIQQTINEGKTLRKVRVLANQKTFIAPNDTRTLLTSHQFKEKTPFETNHSIQLSEL